MMNHAGYAMFQLMAEGDHGDKGQATARGYRKQSASRCNYLTIASDRCSWSL